MFQDIFSWASLQMVLPCPFLFLLRTFSRVECLIHANINIIMRLLICCIDCNICFHVEKFKFYTKLHFYGHFISKIANLDDNCIIGPNQTQLINIIH